MSTASTTRLYQADVTSEEDHTVLLDNVKTITVTQGVNKNNINMI
jgi:hypothetical protein